MKRVLKALGAVFLVIVILCITFILLVLYVKHLNQSFIDEHGITAQDMRESEKVDETNGDISINITGNNFSTTQNEEIYCDSMQEALLSATLSLEPEEQYRRNIDEVIKVFENDKYALVFYRAVKDKKEEAYNYVRFVIRIENGKKQYDFERMRGTIAKYNSIYLSDAREVIQNYIIASEVVGNIGINPGEERFFYGEVCEDFFEEGESIEYFKIEGQKPDEIIEYDSFGKKWYFNDLQSDKKYDELEFTLVEE